MVGLHPPHALVILTGDDAPGGEDESRLHSDRNNQRQQAARPQRRFRWFGEPRVVNARVMLHLRDDDVGIKARQPESASDIEQLQPKRVSQDSPVEPFDYGADKSGPRVFLKVIGNFRDCPRCRGARGQRSQGGVKFVRAAREARPDPPGLAAEFERGWIAGNSHVPVVYPRSANLRPARRFPQTRCNRNRAPPRVDTPPGEHHKTRRAAAPPANPRLDLLNRGCAAAGGGADLGASVV